MSTYACSLSQLVFLPLSKALHPLHFTLKGVCSFALEEEGWGRITEQVPAKPSTMYTKESIEMAECICKPERLHNKMPFLLSCFVLLQGNSNWGGFSCKFCVLCLLTDGWCLDFENQRPQTTSERPFSPIICSNLLTLKNTCNQRGSCQQAPVQVLNYSQCLMSLQAPALPSGGGNMQGMPLVPCQGLACVCRGWVASLTVLDLQHGEFHAQRRTSVILKAWWQLPLLGSHTTPSFEYGPAVTSTGTLLPICCLFFPFPPVSEVDCGSSMAECSLHPLPRDADREPFKHKMCTSVQAAPGPFLAGRRKCHA